MVKNLPVNVGDIDLISGLGKFHMPQQLTHKQQLLSLFGATTESTSLQSVPWNKRSDPSEKPEHCKLEGSPHLPQRERPAHSSEDPAQTKVNT